MISELASLYRNRDFAMNSVLISASACHQSVQRDFQRTYEIIAPNVYIKNSKKQK